MVKQLLTEDVVISTFFQNVDKMTKGIILERQKIQGWGKFSLVNGWLALFPAGRKAGQNLKQDLYDGHGELTKQ